MRWLRWFILVLFIVVLFFLGRAYWRYQRQVAPTPPPAPQPASDWLEDFRYQQLDVQTKTPVYRLHARLWRPQDQGNVEAQQLIIQLFENGRVYAEIQAQHGTWNAEEQRIRLEGDVVVRFRDGLQVHTQRGFYDARKRHFQTTDRAQWSWPQENWTGQAARLIYFEGQRRVETRGGSELTWKDDRGIVWQATSPRMEWDRTRDFLALPLSTRIQQQGGQRIEVLCPRMRREKDDSGEMTWFGWGGCTGSLQVGAPPRKVSWQAFEARMIDEPAGTRWVLLMGTIEVYDRWHLQAPYLSIKPRSEPSSVLEIRSLDTLEIRPVAPVEGGLQRLITGRVWLPAEHAGASGRARVTWDLYFPDPLRAHFASGRVRARIGWLVGQAWSLADAVQWRQDSSEIDAARLDMQGRKLVFHGTDQASTVRGRFQMHDETWTIQAPRVTVAGNRAAWGEPVQIETPTREIRAQRFLWNGQKEPWEIQAVHSARFWQERDRGMVEIVLRTDRLSGAPNDRCMTLAGKVQVQVQRERPLMTVQITGDRGRWCATTWTVEGNPQFRFGPYSGRGLRISGDLENGRITVEGKVAVTNAQGFEWLSDRMIIDMDAQKIDMTNRWPERGVLQWPQEKPPS